MDIHPYVKLAAQAVHYFLSAGNHLPCPSPISSSMEDQAGVFVSIKIKKNHKLRGCIGTVTPSQDNLAKEIIRNAVNAATRDPRFKAITREELGELLFSVDVLTPLEAIDGPDQLNPQRYGLSIRSGNQQGILLPDLKGVDTTKKQIEICLKKASISKNSRYQMYRFEVERYD